MKMDINDEGFSKFYSNILKQKIKVYEENSLQGKCYNCGKVCEGYVNSHSIPQFILKNLCSDGRYYNYFSTANIEFMKDTTGRNQAGSFKLLCQDCEKKLFSNYENESKLENLCISDQQIFKEIALKDYLFQIYKCNYNLSSLATTYEISRTRNAMQQSIKDEFHDELKFWSEVNLTSLNVYENAIKYDNKYYDKEIYKVIITMKLDFPVLIAIQTALPIYKTIEGKTLFDNNNYVFEPYHLFVFPLKETSTISLFGYKYSENTNLLIEEFSKLDKQSIIKIINYIIFAFCEEYYINANAKEIINNNTDLIKLCRSIDKLDLSKWNDIKIPNLLINLKN